MSEFPTLAEVVAKHRWSGPLKRFPFTVLCAGCAWVGDIRNTGKTHIALHAEHVQDVWREACTITTVEQLDALPEGAVVRTTEGRVALKSGYSWGNASGYRSWWSEADESEFDCNSDELDDLPALLIWHPDWSKA